MKAGTTVGLFLLTLMVIFAAAFGAGRLAAPAPTPTPTGDGGPGPDHPAATAGPTAPQHGGGS